MRFGTDVNRGDYKEIKGFGFCDQDLRNLSDHMALFYTGVTRESKEILSIQQKNLITSKEVVSFMHKNVIVADLLSEQLSGYGGRKDIDAIPAAMRENWDLKKKFAGSITNKELDNIYDRARTVGEARAGKIIGAGGGGFFLFWTNNKKKLRETLADYPELPFVIDKYGSRVVLNMEQLSW